MTACCYTDVNGTSCKCRMRADAEADRDRIAREWADVSQSNYQRAKAAEAALATARADALREAAKWCSDEAERCDDASRWGGSRKYVSDCKAAAYALHNARHKIEALIPQNHSPDAGNMVDASALRGIAERDANGSI